MLLCKAMHFFWEHSVRKSQEHLAVMSLTQGPNGDGALLILGFEYATFWLQTQHSNPLSHNPPPYLVDYLSALEAALPPEILGPKKAHQPNSIIIIIIIMSLRGPWALFCNWKLVPWSSQLWTGQRSQDPTDWFAPYRPGRVQSESSLMSPFQPTTFSILSPAVVSSYLWSTEPYASVCTCCRQTSSLTKPNTPVHAVHALPMFAWISSDSCKTCSLVNWHV